MSRRLTFRAARVAARAAAIAAAILTALLLPSTAVPAQQSPGGCDRACLKQMLDTYMAAVFKHDPAAARLSDDHYATENTAVVESGAGFWKEFSGYGAVNRGYFDPLNGAAAFLGVLEQTDGPDKIASVRILVTAGRISEAEWIVASQGPGGRGESNPRGLAQYPPPTGVLAPSERTPRFMMKSLANDFYQAVADHYGEWVPNDPNCYRVENGGGKAAAPTAGGATPRAPTAAAPAAGATPGAPTAAAAPTPGAAPDTMLMPAVPKEGCLGNFEAFDKGTKDIALRRFPVIDEEAGIVLCSVVFVRYPGSGRQDNLVNEYILIRNGKIAAWWTSMYFLPLGSPVTSGWENRHWIRR